MWHSECMLHYMSKRFRGSDDIILLDAVPYSSGQTFAYDEVSVSAWHNRPRSVYNMPDSLFSMYLPLVSSTFSKLCSCETQYSGNSITSVGDLGLGFVLDDSKRPMMSVEGAALFQLVHMAGNADTTPPWLESLRNTWTQKMCLFMFNPITGWKGCFAEHRLWSAVLYRISKNRESLKTPYSVPAIRSWFTEDTLNDLIDCVGQELVMEVANIVAQHNFDGAPDLVLYRRNPVTLMLVEVKSANDKMRKEQVDLLRKLSNIDGVVCKICCHRSAIKRFGDVNLQPDSSDSDSS